MPIANHGRRPPRGEFPRSPSPGRRRWSRAEGEEDGAEQGLPPIVAPRFIAHQGRDEAATDLPRRAAKVTDELHQLLSAMEIEGPHLLVG